MDKIRVGILGATGMVGQKYIQLLENHPWFETSYLVASEKSAGKKYSDAVAGRWHMASNIPENVRELNVYPLDDLSSALNTCQFVFSALDADVARIYEEIYASKDISVVSNASAHRQTSDVPMLIPEINHEHVNIIPMQRMNRGWNKGFIAVKPNCSVQSYLLPLSILHDKYALKDVILITMQAVSGAGHPGVSSYDIFDNIIPDVKGEAEKSEREPLKILGRIEGNKIVSTTGITISAYCNRSPVIDGHMAWVSVAFERKPSIEDILYEWENFKSIPYGLGLPSAPEHAIIYLNEPNRPQPRLDRDNACGMAVTVGGLKNCNVLQYKFVGLSHNTIRGAAGGGILNAELLKAKGYL